jgi:FkbM family methyltransferase
MRTWKRAVADAVGGMLGAHIVPRHAVGQLYEQACIAKILETFGVDCVFDVGANAGQYAIMLRDRLRYRGTIISYEPVPALAAELERMAVGDPGWIIRNLALDSETRDAVFQVTADTQFSSLNAPTGLGHAIFGGQVAVTDNLALTTSTLAAEVTHWRKELAFHRPYLKMDTQGSDIAVAEGAGVLLSSFVAIQTETAIAKLYEAVPDFAESQAYFTGRGFDLSAIIPNNEGHFARLIETDCIFINRALARFSDPGSYPANDSAALPTRN